MPPLSSMRSSGQRAPELSPAAGRRGHGGGLNDSPERAPPALSRRAARAPVDNEQYEPAPFAPGGDGRGGMAGPDDPYDRPTRSQLLGAQARLRMDKADGALQHVASNYRVLFGGHQVVRKGLRRSIADAYAAYVGQVTKLPEDTYGLALHALDRTFNDKGLPTGYLDQNLWASPYATSPAKHAQIFNTACKIMRDLEAYVYDVSYFCPGELDELRQMRRPGSASRDESYKSRARMQTDEPPLEREAVAVAPRRRPTSASPAWTRRPATERRPLSEPPNPDVSPVTGAIRAPPRHESSPGRYPEPGGPLQTAPLLAADRGRRRPGGGGDAATVAAVARSVTATMDTVAAAEADDGPGPRRRRSPPPVVDQLQDRQQRDLRRRGTPGLAAKTPPHLRVSKFYDHLTPSQEVLEQIRQRALQAEEGRAAKEAELANSGPATTPADRAAASRAPPQQQRQPPRPPLDSGNKVYAAAGPQSADRTFGGRAAATAAAAAYPQQAPRREGDARQDSDPDPEKLERILWIIETAYELGLAEVLGLVGPPPYARSERLYPIDYRRLFYEAVYSSPERYAPYTPYAPPVQSAAALGPQRMVGPPWAPRPYDQYDQRQAYHGPGWQYQYAYEYDGPTVERLRAAVEQRAWQAAAPGDPNQMYPRSMRVSP